MSFIQIQLRRDTAANWTSANPTLAIGEMGIEYDTQKFKIGDGSTPWTSLAYGGLVGPTGPTGATGPTGPAGGSTRINQSTAASTWILSHSLGRIPVVSVYLSTDEYVITDYTVTINTITVTFPSPQSGYVLIS